MKAIKSDSDSDSDEQKKVVSFAGENRGVTPSLAAPGVTHPSDATEYRYISDNFASLRTHAAQILLANCEPDKNLLSNPTAR